MRQTDKTQKLQLLANSHGVVLRPEIGQFYSHRPHSCPVLFWPFGQNKPFFHSISVCVLWIVFAGSQKLAHRKIRLSSNSGVGCLSRETKPRSKEVPTLYLTHATDAWTALVGKSKVRLESNGKNLLSLSGKQQNFVAVRGLATF